MADEIMGCVTIIYHTDGHHVLIPPLGLLDRHVQIMQWTLVAPEGYRFDYPGIVFNPPPPLPDGYSSWPGTEIVRLSDWQLQANVKTQVPDGLPQKYRYDIWVHKPDDTDEKLELFFNQLNEEIDPDMENDPKP